jgi:SAM-dependent methyltransferase
MKKAWERLSGIEPRRLWLELSNTQNELSNTQNELSNTQNELSNTQNELSNTKIVLQDIISTLAFKHPLSKIETVDVGVVVTTKNRFAFLLRALKSINLQTRKPKEITVVNNGEQFSEGEEKELRNSCELVSNIKIIDAQNIKDVSECRNKGLLASTSKYITYLDDDNVMWPTWLEKSYNMLSEGNIDFGYGAQLREDYIPHYFSEKFSKAKIMQYNFIDSNSIIHTRRQGRWSAGVTRLTDWSFVLNYLNDHPESEITQLQTISTIYKNDVPDRITSPLFTPYKVLIGLLHNLIPESQEILEMNKSFCIVCNTSNHFTQGPNGRLGATCQTCTSLERHRALKILNEFIWDYLRRNQVDGRIIEVAPSKVSKDIFSPVSLNYSSFDLDPSTDGRDCDFIADICKIPLEDKSVSQFVALHVLEHVQNDSLAMREISRVLAPNGICVLQVPLSDFPLKTQEELILDDAERIAKYGQIDHVRLYGSDIIERLQANGLSAYFISIEEVIPEFLLKILGLKDGMKFILSASNNAISSSTKLENLVKSLRGDFHKLEKLCEIFQTGYAI